MKYKSLIPGMVFCMLYSCSGFLADLDLENEWLVIDNDTVALHYRLPGFTNKPSPTTEEANRITSNQSLYYRAIQDSLGCTFSDKVIIYLYNIDEAPDHIGSTYGGHSIPRFNTIYFSFFHHNKPFTDQYGIEDPFLGAHEMVHVVSHRAIGYPGTTLMSEGYANWLDKSYARYNIIEIIKSYRDNDISKILQPEELLYKTETGESIYYPNAGVFTMFLVKYYGIDIINQLFTRQTGDFITDFETLTGASWSDMEDNYCEYLNKL